MIFTLIGNDSDISNLYGIMDDAKSWLDGPGCDIVNSWTRNLNKIYRTDKKYSILFKGDDATFFLEEIITPMLDNSNDPPQLAVDIYNGVMGDNYKTGEQRERDAVEATERVMLQQRVDEGQAWDTGVTTETDAVWSAGTGWDVEEM
jgi:hypothetical protein